MVTSLLGVSVDTIVQAGGTRAIARALADTGDRVATMGEIEAAEGIVRLAAAEGLAERSDDLADAGAARAFEGYQEMVAGEEVREVAVAAALVGGAEIAQGAEELGAAGALDDVVEAAQAAQEVAAGRSDAAPGTLRWRGPPTGSSSSAPGRATGSRRWTSSASRRPPMATVAGASRSSAASRVKAARTHRHRGEAEGFYLLEGRVEFLGATSTTAHGAGRVRARPARHGARHPDVGTAPAAWLAIWPARLDGFPEELERLESAGAEPAEIAALRRHHGIEAGRAR